MKHIKTFEQFAEQYDSSDRIDELNLFGFGKEDKEADEKLKTNLINVLKLDEGTITKVVNAKLPLETKKNLVASINNFAKALGNSEQHRNQLVELFNKIDTIKDKDFKLHYQKEKPSKVIKDAYDLDCTEASTFYFIPRKLDLSILPGNA